MALDTIYVDLPNVEIDQDELAMVDITRTDSGDSITLTYSWSGGINQPFAVAKDLLESVPAIFPSSWGVVPIGQGERVRYFKRANPKG